MKLFFVVIISIAIISLSAAMMLFTPGSTTVVPLPAPINPSEDLNSTHRGITTIASGLEVPWALDKSDDGRIFLTERPGRIRIIQSDGIIEEPAANIRVEHTGEAGLLGLALHPNFTENHLVYVYHSYMHNGSIFNKVLALTERDNEIIDSKIIIDNIPGNTLHNGGRIKFGPLDGKLYIATGDALEPHLAQNAKSLAGKILRLNPDGSIPDDNPFPGSPVYSYGHRNVQGLAWHPQTGQLYVTEHGPSGNDEINIISPGKNYGWPAEECVGSGSFEPSLICFNPSVAPAGAVFSNSSTLGYQNDLIIATLKGTHLRQVDFESDTQSNILVGFGRLRDVVENTDGTLYILTSNTDGRGIAEAMDDKILHILKS